MYCFVIIKLLELQITEEPPNKSNFVSLLYFFEDKIHSVYVGVVK